MSYAAYILCATPRSGSTLLCDLLGESGVAGKPNSFYRRESIAHWCERWGVPLPTDLATERSYVDAMLEAGRNGTGIFGLRLMFSSLPDLSRSLDLLHPGLPDDPARIHAAFGKTLYVHLSRQDKIAQAVSRLKAEQTGLWHRAADGSERERSAPPQPPVYDAHRLSTFLAESESDNAAWNAWFALHAVTPLRLTYESLSAAPSTALAEILVALGQDPALASEIAPRTAKLSDATSSDWADRFRRERD